MRTLLDRDYYLAQHHHPQVLMLLAAIGDVDPEHLPADHPLHNVRFLDVGIDVLSDPELPQPEHRHVAALAAINPATDHSPAGALHFARLTEELDRRGLTWELLGIHPLGIIDSLTDLYAARATGRPLDPYMHTYQELITGTAAAWWDAAHRWADAITGLADHDPRYTLTDYLNAECDLADHGLTLAQATGDPRRLTAAKWISNDVGVRRNAHRWMTDEGTHKAV
jgi:hypothetical protein